MEGHRLDIHHSLSARRAGATGLLHDHRDGVGFIEKAKTPVRICEPIQAAHEPALRGRCPAKTPDRDYSSGRSRKTGSESTLPVRSCRQVELNS